MRKFLHELLVISACVISAILVMFIFGVFFIGSQYENDYNASLLDKSARLKAINTPKIILVGNSNLSFGMDSNMLENVMNMPVVNLGLHGGLGNAFHENIAKLNINSGDIIIVCHSTYSDDSRITDITLCWVTLEYHKDLWEILRPEDYPYMVMAFPKYWFNSLKHLITRAISSQDADNVSAYRRRSFNKYGDVVIKPDINKPENEIFWPGREKLPEINDICVSRLNELNQYAKERGADLLVAGYPISHGIYSPPDEGYVKFQKELEEKLDCEIISDFRDYFMPYSCFYDFTLHLNEEGTRRRTEQLIRDIKKWQAGRK